MSFDSSASLKEAAPALLVTRRSESLRRSKAMESPSMPRVRLGSQGLEVSLPCTASFLPLLSIREPKERKKYKRAPFSISPPRSLLFQVSRLGFGCFGVAGIFGAPSSDEEAIGIIKQVFGRGITFFDTSDAYGPHTNEILIGKALKHLPRGKVQLATKFGISKHKGNDLEINGKPEYVRASCEASLDRLGVDYIDLYYQHRVDLTVPIEDTMGELKKLVEEGKVKYIGLSEASPDTIRRAHAVHPITAVQMEWSLWTRDLESEVVPLCRNLGIGIVAYSPLGSGFFAGKASVESLTPGSFLLFPQSHLPRFSGDNLDRNKILYFQLTNLAAKHDCTPAQLALAWLLHQGNDVVPIPGTTKIKNLEENIGSLMVKLTEDDLKEISEALPVDEFAGGRAMGPFASYVWQLATTPPKIM
ncbi:hypothetical protein ZIOFF_058759 [Zingiber officinale]|uniref:NADP-dependent oxidoreductase domain-containing protein n=1 Tax=Zingiber officinale TaxID=94328 RepID=A0A8J5F983_ZINOF|nr:hypothetical protein ZIOFF_058759 [Zingiber officinale]